MEGSIHYVGPTQVSTVQLKKKYTGTFKKLIWLDMMDFSDLSLNLALSSDTSARMFGFLESDPYYSVDKFQVEILDVLLSSVGLLIISVLFCDQVLEHIYVHEIMTMNKLIKRGPVVQHEVRRGFLYLFHMGYTFPCSVHFLY